jgi:cation diffusion facilitator CzcD-associated flavoprotein CzcO
MAALPEKARVVIIGQGGIVGASVAHHLVEAGWDDIVGWKNRLFPLISDRPPTLPIFVI